MNTICSTNPNLNTHLATSCIGFHENAPYTAVTGAIRKMGEEVASWEEKNSADEIKKAGEKAVQQFSRDLQEVSKRHKRSSERKRILPLYYSMNTLTVFVFFINSQIKKYSLHFPASITKEYIVYVAENKFFLKSYLAIYDDIALLRYELLTHGVQQTAEEKIKTIYRFLQRLEDKFKEIGQWEESEDGLDWEFWKKILSSPGLLEINFSRLLEDNKVHNDCEKFLKISVQNLCRAYSLLAQQFFEKSQSFFHKCKKIFEEFNSCPQYPGLIYSQDIVKELSNYISNFLAQSADLRESHIEKIVTCKNHLATLRGRIIALEKSKDPQILLLFNNMENLLFLRARLKQLKAMHNLVKRDGTFKYKPLQIFKGTIAGITLSEIQCKMEFTLEDFDKAMEFQGHALYAHVQLDSFLLGSLEQMRAIIEALESWYRKQKKSGQFSKILEFLNNPEMIDSFVEEEWMRDSSSKKNHQFKTTQNKQNISLSNNNNVSTPNKETLTPSTETATASNTPEKSTPIFSPVESALLMLHNLHRLASAEEKNYKYPRIAVRQASMYLHDLTVIYQRLQNEYAPANACELTVSLQMAAYYFMEQLIRYQRLIQQEPFDPNAIFDEHDLKRSYRLLKNKPEHANDKAVHQLYSAYLWIQSTYEQYEQWMRLNDQWGMPIPQPLLLMVNAFEKSSMQSIAASKSKLTEYFNSTIEFGKSLMQFNDQQALPFFQIERSQVHLSSHHSNVSKEIQMIECEILQLHAIRPHSKFSQIRRDLSLIGLKFSRANKPISSTEFSLLMREVVFLQNSILQHFLQIIFEKQTNESTSEHRAKELIALIKWSTPLEEKEIRFIDEYFYNLHNASRYPFEFEPKAILHQILLQAELIREHPEIEEGFELKNEKMISTPLNFIPIAKRSNADELYDTLAISFEKLRNFSLTRLIPELKKH